MSKSSKTADTIQAKQKHERKHLRLCNELFLYQMVVGGHFHMEQPLGSELIHQPEVRDIRLGTLCTTFDMCEVGKLLAPAATKQRRGNNFLRKRSTVYTTSPLFHRSFDHRYCQRRHDHTRIEGKVFHLGKWISLSEYAARYSSGFGRNVARYLAVEVANPSVWWDELQNSGCDVDPAFVGEVMRRRARPGTDAGELNEDASKRRRVHFKQPAQDSQGHAGNEFWVDVFQRIEPEVPRVGKRCFINDEILARVQEGVPGIKIRRIEACRGTERYRLPDSAVDHASVPLRLTVVRKREDSTVQVLGEPEEWTRLPKSRRVRKSIPASMSLTIFGEPVEAATSGAGSSVVGMSRGESVIPEMPRADDTAEPRGGPPRNIPRHGPGFLSAGPEIQKQVRRLHHNLGHPDAQRFCKFLRERQADPSVISAALD